jgi:hypothetical protein
MSGASGFLGNPRLDGVSPTSGASRTPRGNPDWTAEGHTTTTLRC